MRTLRPAVRRPVLLLLAPVAVMAILAACGQEPATTVGGEAPAGPESTSPTERTSPTEPTSVTDPQDGTAEPATADLAIMWDDGAGSGATWTLTCDPATGAGGDHPDPVAACDEVTPASLAPADTSAVCTDVYGGPQTAMVTGTVDGDAVTADLSRTNGCEISRWDALVPLLPPATTGT